MTTRTPFMTVSQSTHTVVLESVVITAFSIAAIGGFKGSAWIVVVGLAGHGFLDAVHGRVVETQECQCGGWLVVLPMISELTSSGRGGERDCMLAYII